MMIYSFEKLKRHVRLPELNTGQLYEFELNGYNFLWDDAHPNPRQLLELDSKGIVLVLMVLYDHPPWVRVIYKDTVGWMRDPVMFRMKE